MERSISVVRRPTLAIGSISVRILVAADIKGSFFGRKRASPRRGMQGHGSSRAASDCSVRHIHVRVGLEED